MMPKISFRKPSSEFGVCTAIRVKFLQFGLPCDQKACNRLGEKPGQEKIREEKVCAEFTFVDSFDRSLEKDERSAASVACDRTLASRAKRGHHLKIWLELTFDEIARTLDLSSTRLLPAIVTLWTKLKEWVPVSLKRDPPKSHPNPRTRTRNWKGAQGVPPAGTFVRF